MIPFGSLAAELEETIEPELAQISVWEAPQPSRALSAIRQPLIEYQPLKPKSKVMENNEKDSQLEALEELKQLVENQPAGPLSGDTASAAVRLLSNCWDLLGGSEQDGTSAHKLLGRTEDLTWEPPCIFLNIE